MPFGGVLPAQLAPQEQVCVQSLQVKVYDLMCRLLLTAKDCSSSSLFAVLAGCMPLCSPCVWRAFWGAWALLQVADAGGVFVPGCAGKGGKAGGIAMLQDAWMRRG
jgi:hypothetical protein